MSKDVLKKYFNPRSKSIAFFNSLNASIELYKARSENIDNAKDTFKFITTWRNKFYKEYQEWAIKEVDATQKRKEEMEMMSSDLDLS